MAITQIIATLPAVLNDSETFYEDIAIRNNSLVTVSFPSINTWTTQANALAVEVNDKAAQVAAQAVDGGYSQTYINTNFVGVNNAQTIAGIKTFSANPISSAAQSSSVNALTRRDFVTTLDAQNIKLTGNQTIAGIKTFSSFPVTPSSTPTTNYQVANKKYVDDNKEATWTANDSRAKTALNASGTAPIYACRAWVNFNGLTTPPAIRASGNVSSVVRTAAGIYIVNLAIPVPDDNYSVSGMSSVGAASGAYTASMTLSAKTASSFTVRSVTFSTGGAANFDADNIACAVFN